jgi:hypothetical protein
VLKGTYPLLDAALRLLLVGMVNRLGEGRGVICLAELSVIFLEDTICLRYLLVAEFS